MGGGGKEFFPRKTSLLFVQAKINLGLGEGGGGGVEGSDISLTKTC